MRAVKHYLQRAAVQGSPTMLAAVTGEHVRGARGARDRRASVPPALRGPRRSATRCSRTAAPSARPTSSTSAASRATTSTCTSTRSRRRTSPFGKRIAHGYFVLSAAAGLFVVAGAGPGAGELRPRHAALRQAGGHRRHDPRAPHLQAQDRPQEGWTRRPRAGRGGVGRRGDQPGRRAGGELRHPDAGGQAGRASRRPVELASNLLARPRLPGRPAAAGRCIREVCARRARSSCRYIQ